MTSRRPSPCSELFKNTELVAGEGHDVCGNAGFL